MPVLLAPLCVVLLVHAQRRHGLPLALLRSLLILLLAVVAVTEMLSLLGLLSKVPVVAAWAGFAAASAAASWRSRGPTWSLPRLRRPELLLILGIALLLTAELVVALVSQPNTMDGMTYHLARVGRWVQQGSVEFSATRIDRQLWSAPLAEYAVTHLQLLSGSVRSANLVQWTASVGVAAGAYRLAGCTGVDRLGRLLAALFACTVPMAVLQSTSTQNDLLVGLWVLAAWDAFFSDMRRPHLSYRAQAAAAVSLAFLTKGTSVLFLAPVGLLWLWVTVRRERGAAVRFLLLAAAVAVAVNGPFQYRVWANYDRPLAPAFVTEQVVAGNHATALVGNGVRNLASEVAFAEVAPELTTATRRLLLGLGMEPDDPELVSYSDFLLRGETQEDVVPSPVHLALIGGAVVGVAVLRTRLPVVVRQQVAVAVLSYLLFAAYLQWQPWINRLLLPGLLVWAAPVAYVLRLHVRRTPAACVAGALVIAGTSALLLNQTRPLYAGGRSVLDQPRDQVMFANRPELRRPYSQAVAVLQARRARDIGLVQGSDDYEYPLRVLSGGVRSPFRLHAALPEDRLPGQEPPRPEGLDAVFCTDLRRCGPEAFPLWQRKDFGSVHLLLPPR
jgi:hypothetical protein